MSRLFTLDQYILRNYQLAFAIEIKRHHLLPSRGYFLEFTPEVGQYQIVVQYRYQYFEIADFNINIDMTNILVFQYFSIYCPTSVPYSILYHMAPPVLLLSAVHVQQKFFKANQSKLFTCFITISCDAYHRDTNNDPVSVIFENSTFPVQSNRHISFWDSFSDFWAG